MLNGFCLALSRDPQLENSMYIPGTHSWPRRAYWPHSVNDHLSLRLCALLPLVPESEYNKWAGIILEAVGVWGEKQRTIFNLDGYNCFKFSS